MTSEKPRQAPNLWEGGLVDRLRGYVKTRVANGRKATVLDEDIELACDRLDALGDIDPAALVADVAGFRVYVSDQLSGPADGVETVAWHRAGLIELTDRIDAALVGAPAEPQPDPSAADESA